MECTPWGWRKVISIEAVGSRTQVTFRYARQRPQSSQSQVGDVAAGDDHRQRYIEATVWNAKSELGLITSCGSQILDKTHGVRAGITAGCGHRPLQIETPAAVRRERGVRHIVDAIAIESRSRRRVTCAFVGRPETVTERGTSSSAVR